VQLLCETGNINSIIKSILTIPWLCLEQSSEATNPFAQPYYSFVQRGKLAARGGNSDQGRPSIPFFDISRRLGVASRRPSEALEYFMELRICHPISDKLFHTLTFGSELIPDRLANEYHNGVLTFCDQVKLDELEKGFNDSRDLLIPEVAFIAHISLTVVKINKKKSYSCLIYTPKQEEVEEGSPQQGRPSDFLVSLSLDQECSVSLFFQETAIDGSSEVGRKALNKLFPLGAPRSPDLLSSKRFILQKAHCELYLSAIDLYNSEQSNNMNHFRNNSIPPAGAQPDTYTINNTQNNYYFNNQLDSGVSGIGRQGHNGADSFLSRNSQYPAPSNHLAGSSDGEFFLDESSLRDQTQSENAVRPNRANQLSASGPSWTKQTMQETSSSRQFNTVTRRQVVPESESQDIESSDSSSESGVNAMESGDKHPPTQSTDVPSTEDLLSDSKLFKKYSNSKTKNQLIHNLLSSIEEKDFPVLLETMRPVIKDVCKNKYGNYVVQVIARSMPSKYTDLFIGIVSSP